MEEVRGRAARGRAIARARAPPTLQQSKVGGVVVELLSSEEDDVLEVVLPPKPTITIDSSDDDTAPAPPDPAPPAEPALHTREQLASPVPSVVSSVSDDFIRGDCIALNISSKKCEQPSFDFSLHGTDLLGFRSPEKKKKKKKSKDKNTSLLHNIEKPTEENITLSRNNCKSKKQWKALPKGKLLEGGTASTVSMEEVADTEVNVSLIQNYAVSDKGIPNADVYDSDSNQSTMTDVNKEQVTVNKPEPPLEVALDVSCKNTQFPDIQETPDPEVTVTRPAEVVDLTRDDSGALLDKHCVMSESIVIANVSGLSELEEDFTENYFDDVPILDNTMILGSTNVPSILLEDLDFYNLKGDHQVLLKGYSLSSLKDDMDKFYNQSWGGENFNHEEIQKYMSRDKSLWAIDPKDRMPSPARRKPLCKVCNRVGHRDTACRLRLAVCHMCGCPGHQEPRCPTKLCVNCGSPNYMYSTACRRCAAWSRLTCPECGQLGHPYSHCPDLWRRYHNTLDDAAPLEPCRLAKRPHELFCSGCARRGHLAHTCRVAPRLSSLPLYSPFVAIYRPIYPYPSRPRPQRVAGVPSAAIAPPASPAPPTLPAPLAPAPPSPPPVLQDSEVSDTSDAVTTAAVYIPRELADALRGEEGARWLAETIVRLGVAVSFSENADRLDVKGKAAAQDAFRNELRATATTATTATGPTQYTADIAVTVQGDEFNIPRNRERALKKLSDAFASLRRDTGDPAAMLRELNYLQGHHRELLAQNAVSERRLANSRDNMRLVQRRLNTLLLGTAGLAGGDKHMRRLRTLHNRLEHRDCRTVPRGLRREIGAHYNAVFSSAPRDDYSTLLEAYYASGAPGPAPAARPVPPRATRPRALARLALYQRRVSRACPPSPAAESTRVHLLARLAGLMSSPEVSHGALSPKTAKKASKLQKQVLLFLNNV